MEAGEALVRLASVNIYIYIYIYMSFPVDDHGHSRRGATQERLHRRQRSLSGGTRFAQQASVRPNICLYIY